MIFRFLISLIGISSFVSSKLVVELQSLNFELTVTSYSYLAILFYDPTNDVGLQYKSTWAEAVSLIENHTICDDCEVAMVNIFVKRTYYSFLDTNIAYNLHKHRLMDWIQI